ncbi:unnamed protein product [Aspergillus oryzae RIB40]|uniref:DNA, SC005 n=2 Tax=Aspergillus oryzae TaxID=5062 RepID=Q2USD1_ASPOR|nr:unnamed protein product [Aspergillus oryzae RIB40]EIT82285.1 beta-xylosidase [Aspergillus oryzae 3.042]KDE76873.1 beta-xylosidase [Aspergillus oryzae 100-8]BAE55534.1 unnamed protein product [Aspergillus oryzae RIB40]|eukprot:EIT82285.1 beta-xylosidase [Aspergillus oryzae 3.042]
MYNNPIIPGFNPDPSIIRVKNDFFLVTSSFEYFPGAPIYHSTDLIRWTLIGHALTRRSQIHIQTPEPGGGVWATTLRYHDGVYYIIAASFERYRPQDDDRVWPRGFYVKTENIWDSGSWSDPVFFDQVGFDQDTSPSISPLLILLAVLPPQNRSSSESLPLVSRRDRIYLSAENTIIFLLPKGAQKAAIVNGLGRRCTGKMVGCFAGCSTGRETFLIPVEWKDDWPIFNRGKKISLQSDTPHLYEYQHPVAWRDDFSSPELQLGWYRKNTPMRTDYSLTERPNHLRLHGGPYNLSVPSCPTLFLRKQIHHYCTWETKLSFSPESQHTEAGTVVWWNYFTYSSIGIRLSPTKEGARIVRFRPAEGEVIDRELRSAVSDVVFFIECGDQYRFGFKEVNGTSSETQWIGEVQNSTMTQSPPVGAPFTGMMLGLYAFGERQRCVLFGIILLQSHHQSYCIHHRSHSSSEINDIKC